MINLIKSVFLKSTPITKKDFELYCKSGYAVEVDARGVKVVKLHDGNYLKVFKRRGAFTSSLIFSNARSFYRNANRLNALGISTVKPLVLLKILSSSDTALVYKPLAGDTVRDMIRHDVLFNQHAQQLGVFIAKLHQSGIHFKSLHFGNIVYTEQGEFGLIDIADMRIFPWALKVSTRLRSFRRITRYSEDMAGLGEQMWQTLVFSYLSHANISPSKLQVMKSSLLK